MEKAFPVFETNEEEISAKYERLNCRRCSRVKVRLAGSSARAASVTRVGAPFAGKNLLACRGVRQPVEAYSAR